MLYLKEYITPSTLLGIWKIEESKERLLNLLSRHEWIWQINNIKSESRILEILISRILLKQLTGEEKEIYYNISGKPFLSDNSYHISISHTKGYVAVALNKEKPIGLDIEHISDKIKRVAPRVIGAREYIDDENEIVHLLLHWCAKEAMFKFLDSTGVDFRQHLFVGRFEPKRKGIFTASESRTNSNHLFDAYYNVNKYFVIVCLEERI